MGVSANSIILPGTDRECDSCDSGHPESSTGVSSPCTASDEKEKKFEIEKVRSEIELLRSQLEAERNMKNKIAEVLTFETGLRRYTNKGLFQSLSNEIWIRALKFYISFYNFDEINSETNKDEAKDFYLYDQFLRDFGPDDYDKQNYEYIIEVYFKWIGLYNSFGLPEMLDRRFNYINKIQNMLRAVNPNDPIFKINL